MGKTTGMLERAYEELQKPHDGVADKLVSAAEKPLGKAWLEEFLGVFRQFDAAVPMEMLDITGLGIEGPQQRPMLSLAHVIEPLLSLVGQQDRQVGNALSIYRWLINTRASLIRIGKGEAADIHHTITLQPTGQGRLQITEHGFLNALTGRLLRSLRTIDPALLHVCEICGHLFLAPRYKSTTCSRQCSNTSRQRKWYEREKGREPKARGC
jgi:hypothetical protein